MISSAAYPSAIYAFIFTASFWCWVALEAWVFLRERGTGRDGSRDRGSTFIVVLILAVGITLALNLPQLLPGFDIRIFFTGFFALGLVLVVAGLLFRLWAIRTLGSFFRTRVVIQEGHRLITSGPYQYLRNPSYTAILIVFLGFGLEIGNWLSVLAFFGASVLAYVLRIALVEEPALAAQFGAEFQEYKKRSWALIPFIW